MFAYAKTLVLLFVTNETQHTGQNFSRRLKTNSLRTQIFRQLLTWQETLNKRWPEEQQETDAMCNQIKRLCSSVKKPAS